MKKKEYVNLLIILLLLGFSYYRYVHHQVTRSRTEFILDTFIEISITGNEKTIEKYFTEAFLMIKDYERQLSYFDTASVLYHINHSKVDSMLIDASLYSILESANKVYLATQGLYDVGIGTLIDLWDFEQEIIPEEEKIQKIVSELGFSQVTFTPNYLVLPSHLKLNLNSLCKGYIVDQVIDFLARCKVHEAIVNAGGDLRFYSSTPRTWKLGIRHPREQIDTIITLNIPELAVATSGDYEKYFYRAGKRYHHILNPQTGYPSENAISATVFSSSALLADALSTAALVMEPYSAITMIKSFPDTEAIIYYYDEQAELVSLRTNKIKEWLIGED